MGKMSSNGCLRGVHKKVQWGAHAISLFFRKNKFCRILKHFAAREFQAFQRQKRRNER